MTIYYLMLIPVVATAFSFDDLIPGFLTVFEDDFFSALTNTRQK